MNTVSQALKSIIFWTIAIPWCITGGLLIGMIGKTVGMFENIIRETRSEYTLWRRHPLRQKKFWYIQHKNTLWHERSKAQGLERHTIQRKMDKLDDLHRKGKLSGPNPITYGFFWTLCYVSLLPFSLMAGMVEGPMILYADCKFFWQRHILKRAHASKFDHLIPLLSQQAYMDAVDDD